MMYSLWLLPAALPAALFYVVRQIRRAGEHALGNAMPSVPRPHSQSPLALASSADPTRVMNRISFNEFVKVLARCDDLIAIELRPYTPLVPFQASTALFLPVAPKELDRVLEQLPADKIQAFHCASNPNIFLIETGPWVEEPVPCYLLAGNLALGEVA